MAAVPSETDMAEQALQAFSATEAARMQALARAAGYEAGYAKGRRDGVMAERRRCLFLLTQAGFHEAATELGLV